MNRKLLIIIFYGPELRPFIQSGGFKIFNNRGLFSIIALKENELSEEFLNYSSSNVISFKKEYLLLKRGIFFKIWYAFELYFKKVRQYRKNKFGLGQYHFSKGASFEEKRFTKIIGSEFYYRILNKIYNIIAPKVYESEYFKDILVKNGVTDLLYYGSNLPEMKVIQHTTKNLGLKLWHYIGNWKDIYIDDHIPVIPDKIFVWSDKIKADIIKLNPKISNNQVVVTGNWFFNNFKGYKAKMPRSYYGEKYNFEPDRLIILWPLSMKVVFPNEHILIAKIDAMIDEIFSFNKPIIILRDNPFGAADDLIPFYKNLKNVRLAKNFWKVNRKEDFIFQTDEGEQEWLDLLYYTFFIVSTPSTVSLEGILMKKMSVNILFDDSGKYSEKIAAFAKAPFYSELLTRSDVKMINDIDAFRVYMQAPDKISDNFELHIPDIISGNRSFDFDNIVDIIMS